MSTEKIYCYVDETGQDTAGNLFIVVIAIAATTKQRDLLGLSANVKFCKSCVISGT